MSQMIDLSFPSLDRTLEARMKSHLDVAQAYVIDSQDMFDAAASDLLEIKKLKTALDAQKKIHVEPLSIGVKTINDFYRAPAAYLIKAEIVLKSAMKFWFTDQEKKAEQERKRIEEAHRAPAREAADTLPCAPVEHNEARHPKASIKSANTPLRRPAAPPKTAGISTRKVWKSEVTDMVSLIKFIADNPEYVDLLTVNMRVLNDFVQLRKGALKIDGVNVYEDSVIAARSQ